MNIRTGIKCPSRVCAGAWGALAWVLTQTAPRRMATVPLMLLVITTIAGPWATGARADRETLSKEEKIAIPLDGETQIYVKNSRGKTIIIGRRDTDVVLVRAEKYVRARDAETAQRWMDELTSTVRQDGNEVAVTTQHPKDSEQLKGLWALIRGFKYKAFIDYTIEVPADFDARVSSASGNVQITSLGGSVRVHGASGNVFLKDIGGETFVELASGDLDVANVRSDVTIRLSSGDAVLRDLGAGLDVRATSGDVEVFDVAGDVDLELSSGGFVIDGCGGNVSARTVSGDGEVSAVDGNIEAIASSGDLYLSIVPVGSREFAFQTTSGDITINFAAQDDYGFYLDINTSSGTIEGDLDIRLDKVSRRMLRGVVGSGSSKVLVETASGDISIRESGGD